MTGQARGQATLFPERLEEFITEDNPVRVLDSLVEELELRDLGFTRVDPLATAVRPITRQSCSSSTSTATSTACSPTAAWSVRTQRNVGLMWLTELLAQDHKTIADFRKDNGKAIRQVCREFIVLCRRLELFSESVVAIDGSMFKAVNNRDRNFTRAKLKRRLEQFDESIARYLSQLDSADREESVIGQAKRVRLVDHDKADAFQWTALARSLDGCHHYLVILRQPGVLRVHDADLQPYISQVLLGLFHEHNAIHEKQALGTFQCTGVDDAVCDDRLSAAGGNGQHLAFVSLTET